MEHDTHVDGRRRVAEGERLMELEAILGIRMQGLVISATTCFTYFLITRCLPFLYVMPTTPHCTFFLYFIFLLTNICNKKGGKLNLRK